MDNLAIDNMGKAFAIWVPIGLLMIGFLITRRAKKK